MANYFKGAREFTINGGTFGQDYSRHNTYHGPVHRTNDYSKHTTNYNGYVNHGQHASRGGTINNLGPQTTNNGPIYGNQRYAGSRGDNRRSPRPPPPEMDDEFNMPPRSGQQSPRRYPQQDPRYARDSDRNIYDDDDDDDDDDDSGDEDGPSLPPPHRRAQPAAVSPRRPQAELPRNPGNSLEEELKTLSPEMRRYVKKLARQQNGSAMPPAQPERDLQDRMASMQLDDAESSRPSSGRSSPRNPPRKPPARATRLPPARVSDDDESESDEDPVSYGSTTITSTDSQNVNSTTVVDSHNDNSTKTEISKTYSAR